MARTSHFSNSWSWILRRMMSKQKEKVCVCFLLFVINVGRAATCTGLNDLDGRDIREFMSYRSDTTNGSFKPIVISLLGKFNQTYSFVINSTEEYLFQFEYDSQSQIKAVRVHTETEDAEKSSPLLFVVWQKRGLVSWQLPLIVSTTTGSKQYNTSSHTLCPDENYPRLNGMKENKKVLVGISTWSNVQIHFNLTVTRLNDEFDVSDGDTRNLIVSPSEPYYYQFKFKEDIDAVLLKTTSDDDVCMMVSVQNITCPVFDSESNVQFEGVWQTMYKTSGITIRRDVFPKGFYIVFVVLPDDTKCMGDFQTIYPDRQKNVTLTIKEKTSEKYYIMAIVFAIFMFLAFYIFSFVVSCLYFVRRRREPLESPLEEPASETVCHVAVRNYGSIRSSSREIPSESSSVQNQPSNVDNNSDSSAAEEDYDDLDDMGQWKDVFRCHPTLYVADLARKSPRALARKSQMYLWNIITVAVFYALPVVQLVFTNQKVLNDTGNQDLCYYNFLCSHPLGPLSDFNHIFSNIGYVMLGFLFVFLTLRKDWMHHAMVKLDPRMEKYYGIPQHYGLFYAMGTALMMEGVLSACYHVCPNHDDFQFDASFMYVISILCMIKIYQSRHPDVNASAYIAFGYLALFIFIGVIGVLQGSLAFWIIFTVFHIILCFTVSANVYFMGRWKLDCGTFQRVYWSFRNDFLASPIQCFKPHYIDRMVLLVIGNLVNWGFAVYGAWRQPVDFAFHLLSIFIVNLLLYTSFYIIMKLRHRERILPQPLIYIFLSVICWNGALYFFFQKCTTWQLTPAQSRAYNKECLILNFYDDHDIWHFLSAASMFFSFMILLTLDDDLMFVPRDKIPVF